MRNFLPLMPIVILVTACATAPIDPNLLKKANSMKVIKAEQRAEYPLNRYEIIRDVIGVSCAKQAGSSPSADEARSILRLKAAEVGADAIFLGSCEESGSTLKLDCWRSIECRALAIKWKNR
jgi:hypothetical protein